MGNHNFCLPDCLKRRRSKSNDYCGEVNREEYGENALSNKLRDVDLEFRIYDKQSSRPKTPKVNLSTKNSTEPVDIKHCTKIDKVENYLFETKDSVLSNKEKSLKIDFFIPDKLELKNKFNNQTPINSNLSDISVLSTVKAVGPYKKPIPTKTMNLAEYIGSNNLNNGKDDYVLPVPINHSTNKCTDTEKSDGDRNQINCKEYVSNIVDKFHFYKREKEAVSQEDYSMNYMDRDHNDNLLNNDFVVFNTEGTAKLILDNPQKEIINTSNKPANNYSMHLINKDNQSSMKLCSKEQSFLDNIKRILLSVNLQDFNLAFIEKFGGIYYNDKFFSENNMKSLFESIQSSIKSIGSEKSSKLEKHLENRKEVYYVFDINLKKKEQTSKQESTKTCIFSPIFLPLYKALITIHDYLVYNHAAENNLDMTSIRDKDFIIDNTDDSGFYQEEGQVKINSNFKLMINCQDSIFTFSKRREAESNNNDGDNINKIHITGHLEEPISDNMINKECYTIEESGFYDKEDEISFNKNVYYFQSMLGMSSQFNETLFLQIKKKFSSRYERLKKSINELNDLFKEVEVSDVSLSINPIDCRIKLSIHYPLGNLEYLSIADWHSQKTKSTVISDFFKLIGSKRITISEFEFDLLNLEEVKIFFINNQEPIKNSNYLSHSKIQVSEKGKLSNQTNTTRKETIGDKENESCYLEEEMSCCLNIINEFIEKTPELKKKQSFTNSKNIKKHLLNLLKEYNFTDGVESSEKCNYRNKGELHLGCYLMVNKKKELVFGFALNKSIRGGTRQIHKSKTSPLKKGQSFLKNGRASIETLSTIEDYGKIINEEKNQTTNDCYSNSTVEEGDLRFSPLNRIRIHFKSNYKASVIYVGKL